MCGVLQTLLLICNVDDVTAKEKIARWLAANRIETLNVAGPSASSALGIAEKANTLLRRVFEKL